MKKSIKWTDDVAELWEKVVPPSRPAISELNIYSEYLRNLQKELKRKVDILVLGSTTEFRDWGYENNCNVSVIDYCREYYSKISTGLKYKNNNEVVYFKKWQEMNFFNEFDIVIGDLATGNVPLTELDILFKKVHSSLRENGLFLGKSMCYNPKASCNTIESVIESYLKLNIKDHAYTHIFYQLAINYIDVETHIWNNRKMFEDLKQLYLGKKLDKDTYESLAVVGDMNVSFTIIPFEYLLNIGKKYYELKDERFGEEAYSEYFPLYVFQKKGELHD